MPSPEENQLPSLMKQAGTMLDPAMTATANAVLNAIINGDPSQPQAPSIVQNTVSGLVGDWIGEWRSRRLISLLSDTAKIAEKHGLDPSKLQSLPNGERYRILDGATRNDDPLIGKMWASLLISDVTDNESRDRIIRLLDNMTGDDARLLTFIHAATPLGEAVEDALEALEKVKSDGYVGQKRSRWHYRKPDSEHASKEEYEDAISSAKDKIKTCSEPLEDLENKFIASGDMYAARAVLLRLGLIQRRSVNIPSTSDFESSQTVLVSSDYRGGHNDWEEVHTCNPEAVGTAIEELHNLIAEHTGYSRNDLDPPEFVQYNNRFNVCPWGLTSLGESLYEACSLRAD